MTETTANIEPREEIKPIPFIAALILGPLVFTAPFGLLAETLDRLGTDSNGLMLVAVIPVAALFFGAVPYLLFGTPAFIMALRKGGSPAGAAFIANAVAVPFVFLFIAASSGLDGAGGMAGFMFAFGCVFAPIWGAVFGKLYNVFS